MKIKRIIIGYTIVSLLTIIYTYGLFLAIATHNDIDRIEAQVNLLIPAAIAGVIWPVSIPLMLMYYFDDYE